MHNWQAFILLPTKAEIWEQLESSAAGSLSGGQYWFLLGVIGTGKQVIAWML